MKPEFAQDWTRFDDDGAAETEDTTTPLALVVHPPPPPPYTSPVAANSLNSGDDFPPENKAQTVDGDTRNSKAGLPPVVGADDLVKFHDESAAPVELVAGVLHRGEKFMLAGTSKGRKSWALIDLAVSVAAGKPFLGLQTTKSRVLLLNFEIQPFFMGGRIKKVRMAKCLESVPNLDVWNLRGHRTGFDDIIASVREMIGQKDYALIIIDPLYSGLQGKDENKAGDIAALMSDLETLAVQNAAVAMAHHFAKGNSAMKDSLDRASGSGVFARDPDCIVTLNNHEEGDAFVCEFTLRNFPPKAKLGLRLEFPLLVPAEDLDTDAIKGAKLRAATVSVQDLADLLPVDADMETCVLKGKALTELGIKDRKFYALLKEAKGEGVIVKTEDGKNRKILSSPKKSK